MTGRALRVIIQHGVRNSGVPADSLLERCALAVLDGTSGELAVRIVDEDESARLNAAYRGVSGPTNVLAFPAGDGPVPADEPAPLGDIAICAPVVAREADAQGKSADAHWAHMVVHGCLHLLGYDHMNPAEAEAMESRERELLAGLGIGDPYDLR